MSALLDSIRHRARVRRQGNDERANRHSVSKKIGTARLALPVAALVWVTVLPPILDIGGIRITVNRFVLLVMVLPCFAQGW